MALDVKVTFRSNLLGPISADVSTAGGTGGPSLFERIVQPAATVYAEDGSVLFEVAPAGEPFPVPIFPALVLLLTLGLLVYFLTRG